ncbi:MAG TPA: asparaginase [Longimicrobiales bacterium]|nr:asparaginase [Longimicrobiales bacterium]
MAVRVEVWRGAIVESRHQVSVAVADGEGRMRAHAGDPDLVVFARSSIKPLQAVPLVEDGIADRFGLTEEELALVCASHSGEPAHVAVARSILARIGVSEEALGCGADRPFGEAAARALAAVGEQPGRIHNNCSGKHAGMLALALGNGWPVAGYVRQEHPVQERMLAAMAEWSGLAAEDIGTAVDGCGVITFALPLSALARVFGRFAGSGRRSGTPAARILRAMARHPEMVAGAGRLDTDIVRVTSGRVIAKVGAEGVFAALVPGAELGVVLKVEDGATRAAGPALVGVLCALGVLTEEEVGALERYAEPDVMNTRRERVGAVRAVVELEAVDG